MRHTSADGETLEIEVEVPSLAFLADAAMPEALGDREAVAATIADAGALIPGRDAWSQAHEAASQPSEGEYVERAPGVHSFRFRVRVPADGRRHLFKVSMLRTRTALDSSGTRRDPKLYPTEQTLIGVTLAPMPPDAANQREPALPIPDRPGAGRFTPGVTLLRAITHDDAMTLAQGDTPEAGSREL